MYNENIKGEERKKWTEDIFEVILAENFPKLMTTLNHRSRKIEKTNHGKYKQHYTWPYHS